MKKLFIACTALTALVVTGCSIPFQTTVTAKESGLTVSTTATNAEPMAPAFKLKDLETGQMISLQTLLAEGHPVVLNAFGSWCGPCNKEAPDLQAVYQQYRGKVTFAGIAIFDTTTGVKSFVAKYGLTYPVLLDTQNKFVDAYALSAPPETFIITPNGKIAAKHVGILSKSAAESIFKSAAKLA